MEETTLKSRVIGVDISIDWTSIAIVDVRGNIIARDGFSTAEFADVNDYVNTLSERVMTLAENNGGYDKIRSMGVGAPSANYKTGCIENAANLHWKGVVPLAALLRDRLGIAVAVGNDAYLSALGEREFGSAHGLNNFVIISLGHGNGSCIFTNGEVHMGADGFAGEFGHMCVDYGGRTCGCGKKGCLEAYCATRGIVMTARELMNESSETSLMHDIPDLTPRKICECCERGDKLAIETFRRTGVILGSALAAMATVLDPEAIIFTGGIAHAGHWLLGPAKETFDNQVFHNIKGRVRFLQSTLDNHERDMLGASALAWGIKEYSLFK